MYNERFAFGKNWQRYARKLTDGQIRCAEQSLTRMLKLESLHGVKFLDVGSGSGLFSLAAVRLGAEVVSIDLDEDSVECTLSLRSRYAPDAKWEVRQGSVLDKNFLHDLGTFDVVYAWGVLHHTGSMWEAFGNVATSVKEGGLLYIGIYNDQGTISSLWRTIKRAYNASPRAVQFCFVLGYAFLGLIYRGVRRLIRENSTQRNEYGNRDRGMKYYYDIVDWLGGYPYEVARPEQIFLASRDRGFELLELVTKSGSGCNEFVFSRKPTKLGGSPVSFSDRQGRHKINSQLPNV